MTIELSLLLSGVSVAFAIFFGICSKQRNEKKDTQEDAEQRATTDTMVMVKLENIAEPSTLIENVFRFLSVEGGAMALIKSVKTVKGTKSNGEIQHNDEPEQNDEEVQG